MKDQKRRINKSGQLAPPAVIVFDGDDTLWATERLYDTARMEARRIVEAAGMDGSKWEAIERKLDVDNVALLGYSPKRFPKSCIQAYRVLCNQSGRAADESVAQRIGRAAMRVFERRAVAMSGTRLTLKYLRQRGIRLALLTKGDTAVQRRRIEQSGLEPLFDEVRIVSEKSPATIRSTVSALGAEPSEAWMVGNSIRSDMTPALKAGLVAIWIDAPVWEHERVRAHGLSDRMIELHALADIPKLIAA